MKMKKWVKMNTIEDTFTAIEDSYTCFVGFLVVSPIFQFFN